MAAGRATQRFARRCPTWSRCLGPCSTNTRDVSLSYII
jgi:hypothetical protein